MTRMRWLAGLALTLAASMTLAAQSAQELYQRGLVLEHANGDLTKAIAAYAEVTQAAGKDRPLAAKALRRMAAAQEKLGREVEAAEAYATLVRLYPEQRTEVAIARDRLAALRRKTSTGVASPSITLSAVPPVVHAFVETYCVVCHNARNKSAGLDLDELNRATVGEHATQWEKVARRLLARRDPPIGARRPDEPTYSSVVSKLHQALDASYAANRSLLPPERVTDSELATRLAAFLWNGPPDSPLLEAARRGDLQEPEALQRQVVRMLRDSRSVGLVDGFFAPWLSLDRIKPAQHDSSASPQTDAELLDSMATETRLFLHSQLREDRDAVEVWTANYTYVNERLGRHYGLPGISGREFRRMTWPTQDRGGLLGQAGPLTAQSMSGRTSPTKRGLYLLTRYMGLDAPQPPANVPPMQERPDGPASTLRDRLTAHRTSPGCANCHSMFDPLGLALENFDATGAWRLTDDGSPIDASGAFVDGRRFNGPAELRAGLLKYRDAYYHSVARQLMAYALHRRGKAGSVYDYEMPAVRKVVRDASGDSYRWSSILAGIVASAPFQMKNVIP